jgi:hypothetical protein
MLTSAECREMAKQNLLRADLEPQRRTRLLTAAQAWLILESKLRRVEAKSVGRGRLRLEQRAAGRDSLKRHSMDDAQHRGIAAVSGVHQAQRLHP